MIIRRHLSHNFTIIPNDALLDTRLSIGSRWLLAYLLSRPHDWQVQVADIQKQANVGRDKAYGLVKELISVGWVRKDESRQTDGRWGGVEYVVMDQPEAASEVAEPLPENPKAADPIAANQHLTKDGGLPNTERTKPILSDAALAEEFEEFWAAYPKRPNNPRKAAMKAYLKARRDLHVSQKHLLTKVAEYAAYMAGENPKFIAMASTWLNGERWESDFAKDAEVTKAYKGAAYDDGPDPLGDIDLSPLAGVMAAYPRRPVDPRAVAAAIKHQKAEGELEAIAEAVEKYTLLIKRQREDGLEPAPATMEAFIRFKWREIAAGYEFCHVGMLGKRSVRPRREVRA